MAAQDAAEIIRQSAEANDRDWTAAPGFDNSERDRTKDGDKTHAVTMLDGSPYERLIAVDGHDLSAAKQQEEEKNPDIREHGDAPRESCYRSSTHGTEW